MTCESDGKWRISVTGGTDGQSLTTQVAELKAASCTEIFQEKVSGAKSAASSSRA